VFAGSGAQLVGGVVFTALIVYAAFRDVRSRRIPNATVAILVFTGIVYATAVVEAGLPGLLRGLAGLGVGLVIWLPFHALGWIGAGDVKLFAAAGAWLGPARTLEGALMAALAGAVLAFGWMLWSYGVRRTVTTISIGSVVPSILAPGEGARNAGRTLPYGVALAAGALAAGWLPRLLLFG
jgi:prepilin peptidase CpaA